MDGDGQLHRFFARRNGQKSVNYFRLSYRRRCGPGRFYDRHHYHYQYHDQYYYHYACHYHYHHYRRCRHCHHCHRWQGRHRHCHRHHPHHYRNGQKIQKQPFIFFLDNEKKRKNSLMLQ